ncbi:hypothetical protein [Tunturibacter empetritectus]|uniref:Uncharacterized protein n=1 Tax=Tunturiibacter lichenicola TaxID=2051959 RepID=A0A7W8N416_9BACT|nr:hypothetical protein [Edaphobacter lichenicola]MBB5343126.1 hypothetical protein [Edaphobacter lichenicola]
MRIEFPLLDWKGRPLSVRILHALFVVGFISFIPVLLWHQRVFLAIAATLTWIGFMYAGLFALFASRQTVIDLWYPPNSLQRLLPWNSEGQALIAIRLIGTIAIGFVSFMAYVILRNGTTVAYNHLGR